MEAKEGVRLIGQVIVEELVPGTDIVLSREVGENIICKKGADMLATVLQSGAGATVYNYMIMSSGQTPEARATLAIEAVRNQSSVIVPTLAITGTTSIVTWVNTFAAMTGATATWKFGMESAASGGELFNEYLFLVAKDNWNNDLKLTYNVSIAP